MAFAKHIAFFTTCCRKWQQNLVKKDFIKEFWQPCQTHLIKIALNPNPSHNTQLKPKPHLLNISYNWIYVDTRQRMNKVGIWLNLNLVRTFTQRLNVNKAKKLNERIPSSIKQEKFQMPSGMMVNSFRERFFIDWVC